MLGGERSLQKNGEKLRSAASQRRSQKNRISQKNKIAPVGFEPAAYGLKNIFKLSETFIFSRVF